MKKDDIKQYADIKQGKTGGEERRLARWALSKKIMDKVKKELEKYGRSNYKKLGKQIKRALVYAKKEWHAFETVLQNGDVEVSNNLCEQMMKHIKMNLKNCLNIGSEGLHWTMRLCSLHWKVVISITCLLRVISKG